jgi:hypothetical protein
MARLNEQARMNLYTVKPDEHGWCIWCYRRNALGVRNLPAGRVAFAYRERLAHKICKLLNEQEAGK